MYASVGNVGGTPSFGFACTNPSIFVRLPAISSFGFMPRKSSSFGARSMRRIETTERSPSIRTYPALTAAGFASATTFSGDDDVALPDWSDPLVVESAAGWGGFFALAGTCGAGGW